MLLLLTIAKEKNEKEFQEYLKLLRKKRSEGEKNFSE
jgi:hypothetical protein